MGDHGHHIGEQNRFTKHSLWEEAARAPLIFSAPNYKKNQVCHKPVGMIDIYPTLLDLAGLPENPANEGHSVKPLLSDPNNEWQHAAITTYERNNHAVRTEKYRYIQYEDGSEELYDHKNDQDEWQNLALDPAYQKIKTELKTCLPKVNESWAPTLRYDYNQYFIDQKKRESN